MSGLVAPRDDTGKVPKPVMNFMQEVERKLNAGSQVADITADDATDPASVIVLANDLKVAMNELLAALKLT